MRWRGQIKRGQKERSKWEKKGGLEGQLKWLDACRARWGPEFNHHACLFLKPGVVVQVYKPSTGEAKTGGSLGLTRSGSLWENLSPNTRLLRSNTEADLWPPHVQAYMLTETLHLHTQRHCKHTEKERRKGREVTAQLFLCCLITERNSYFRMQLNEVGQVSSSCAWEAESSRGQGHSWLHKKFKANLDYKKSCLKKEGRLYIQMEM